MSKEMICPYCQRELLCIGILHAQDNHTIWYCPKCATEKQLWRIANKELWQALIQAKQDLGIARKALESISGIRGNIEDYYGGVSIHYQQMVLHMDEIATNALEQITHDNSEKANSQ